MQKLLVQYNQEFLQLKRLTIKKIKLKLRKNMKVLYAFEGGNILIFHFMINKNLLICL